MVFLLGALLGAGALLGKGLAAGGAAAGKGALLAGKGAAALGKGAAAKAPGAGLFKPTQVTLPGLAEGGGTTLTAPSPASSLLQGTIGKAKAAGSGLRQLGFQLGQRVGLAQQAAPVLPGSLPAPSGGASALTGAPTNPFGLTALPSPAPPPSSLSPFPTAVPPLSVSGGQTLPGVNTALAEPPSGPGSLERLAQGFATGAPSEGGGVGGGSGGGASAGAVPVPVGGAPSIGPSSGAEGFGDAGTTLSPLLPQVPADPSNQDRLALARGLAERIILGSGGQDFGF